MRMELLHDYLSDLRFIRDTGAGVAETSYYAALGNLLNGIGGQLKPAVKCVLTVKNQGAGLPDGGFFTPDQTGLPPRCLAPPGAEAECELRVGQGGRMNASRETEMPRSLKRVLWSAAALTLLSPTTALCKNISMSATPGASPLSPARPPKKLSPYEVARNVKVNRLMMQGTQALRHNKPAEAVRDYQAALALKPKAAETVGYGPEMGDAFSAVGRWKLAVKFYRTAFYSHGVRDPGDLWGSPSVVMKYIVALLHTGGYAEAELLYNHAAHEINYVDGKQEPPVLIPLWNAKSADDSPQRLEALAHIGICAALLRWDEMLPNADAAIRLAPHLAEAHFYRAYALDSTTRRYAEAIAEYKQAERLGNAAVKAKARAALDTRKLKWAAQCESKQ